MFVRKKRGGNRRHPHDYLQIVESYRDQGLPKQRVIATLGRLDHLTEDGRLDGLIESLARFAQHVRVVSAARRPQIQACVTKLWGPPLVFGRLWQRQALPEVLASLAERRRFEFDLERTAFALALQRLCCPGSDLQGSRWVDTVEEPGFEPIALQHLYRTVGWLAEVRADLERQLFARDRDLFTQELDLVFLDTTSLYVYRDTETEYRRRGYSRDRRPDLPQFVLAVAVDRAGWPVAWELFPGNTMDRKAFVAVVHKLRTRLHIRQVMVVADRAMIGKDTLAELTEHDEAPFDYILGCRLRGSKEVRDEVLSRGGRYCAVAGNLRVKQVCVGERRYIVCHNPAQERKDAAKREAILARLQTRLSREPKGLLKNQGVKRFTRVRRGSIEIDHGAVAADARYDGKFVLTTNTDLSPQDVATTYKSLWRVERTFRQEKSTLAVRPVYHHRDDTSIGHIVASFLALRLEVDLERRLEAQEVQASWPELMHDLSQVQAVHLGMDGRGWRVRTDLRGASHAAFQAAGVRPPPRVTALEDQATV
ncbi:IS1634 family transposase [bacterium]|nr:IS1634 family transposase [bacterium]